MNNFESSDASGNKDSNWGNKTKTFDIRTSEGSWRDGSDKGSFRGRRDSNRGGFEGPGKFDRGGFGGSGEAFPSQLKILGLSNLEVKGVTILGTNF